MTASLYSTRLAYNHRVLPWHGLGTAIQDDISVVEAIQVARADYPVYLAVAEGYYLIDKNGAPRQHVASGQVDGASTDNAVAVLRGPSYDDDKYYVLGKASSRFELMQNIDLARMVEPLRKWGNVETVGALENGERFFISFRGGKWSFLVNGKEDAHEIYLIVKNTHLPGACLQFQLSGVRVVCRNTWDFADNSAVMNLPLAHTADLHMVSQWVVNVLDALPAKRETMKAQAELMAATPVTDADVKRGIDKAIPMPTARKVAEALKNQKMLNLPPELESVVGDIDSLIERKDRELSAAQTRIQAMRSAAWDTYRQSETVDRGTAWGGFNAITETIDHVVRSATAIRQTKKAMSSNFWGERQGWKQNALQFFTNPNNFKN